MGLGRADQHTPGISLSSSVLHFDLEVESGSESQNEWERAQLAAQVKLFQSQLTACLFPLSIFHQRLLRDIRLLKRSLLLEENDDGQVDPVILATKLSSIGYRVNIRSALGGNSGSTDCFYNLRNEFLIVTSEEGDSIYICELNFKSHFEIPQPTRRYSALLDSIPTEVAIPPNALASLVHLMCSEMSLAFQERGLSLPPWRQSKSLLSKWMPTKAKDVDISTPSSSPRAASPRCGPTDLMSALNFSSGILTPSGTHSGEEGESPRAVLQNAAAVLNYRRQRSLLTSDLAAGGASPKAKTEPPSPKSSTDTKPQKTAGWATPPIRRVRMAGAMKKI